MNPRFWTFTSAWLVLVATYPIYLDGGIIVTGCARCTILRIGVAVISVLVAGTGLYLLSRQPRGAAGGVR